MTILECFESPALYTFYMAGIVVGTVKSSNEKGLKDIIDGVPNRTTNKVSKGYISDNTGFLTHFEQ